MRIAVKISVIIVSLFIISSIIVNIVGQRHNYYRSAKNIENLEKNLSFTDNQSITIPLEGSCVKFGMFGINHAHFSAYLVNNKVIDFYKSYQDIKLLLKSDMFDKKCDKVNDCFENRYIENYQDYKIIVIDNNLITTGEYLYNIEECNYNHEFIGPVIFLTIELLVFVIFIGLICQCF